MDNKELIENLQVDESTAKESENGKQPSGWKTLRDAIYIVCFVAMLWGTVALLNSPILSSDSNKYVEKVSLQKKISVMVKNGASLDLVKHAFEMQTMVRPRLFKRIEPEHYYSDKIPLSIVLNDISVNYLSTEPFVEDSVFFARLCYIIQENQYHNPFDNLEESQVPFFENVRVKSGGQYEMIQDDVVRIATEMSHKNQLVTTYLNRSNLSFIISIGALALTIILSIVQLIQGGKTNKRIEELFLEEGAPDVDDETLEQ